MFLISQITKTHQMENSKTKSVKRLSDGFSLMGMFIYGALILVGILLIILGIEEFASMIVPELLEAVKPF